MIHFCSSFNELSKHKLWHCEWDAATAANEAKKVEEVEEV
jgi:hypothetical protein